MSEKKWKIISAISLTLCLISSTAFAWFFYFGRTHTVDQRRYIEVTSDERHMILKEMRNLLGGLRGIIKAVSEGDSKKVAINARRNGMIMATEAKNHAALVTKLPMEFKRLGFGTHKSFDRLADRAHQMSNSEILNETATIMNNCIACHSTYRITD